MKFVRISYSLATYLFLNHFILLFLEFIQKSLNRIISIFNIKKTYPFVSFTIYGPSCIAFCLFSDDLPGLI